MFAMFAIVTKKSTPVHLYLQQYNDKVKSGIINVDNVLLNR